MRKDNIIVLELLPNLVNDIKQIFPHDDIRFVSSNQQTQEIVDELKQLRHEIGGLKVLVAPVVIENAEGGLILHYSLKAKDVMQRIFDMDDSIEPFLYIAHSLNAECVLSTEFCDAIGDDNLLWIKQSKIHDFRGWLNVNNIYASEELGEMFQEALDDSYEKAVEVLDNYQVLKIRDKKKIYISGSRAADWSNISAIKQLIEFSDNEVLEYHGTGKEYDPSQLLKADLIIVVPPKNGITNESVKMGKGNYSEILMALRKGIPVYIITNLKMSKDLCTVALIKDEKQLKIINKNWSTEYAEFRYSKLHEINFTERVLNINLEPLKINNIIDTPEITKEESKEERFFGYLY